MEKWIKKAIFVLIFSVAVFISRRIEIANIVGGNGQTFSGFQLFGPVAGQFLGGGLGAAAVLLAEIVDVLAFNGSITLIGIGRLFTMAAAAFYLGARKKNLKTLSLIVPILAFIAFNLNPIGRKAWLYSLLWTIPIIIRILPKKIGENLYLKSLGATFTAHALGSVIWLWTFQMTPAQWLALIPIAAAERLIFAGGITLSAWSLNKALDILSNKVELPTDVLHIDKA